MSPRLAALLFVAILGAELLPRRASLANEADAGDHPPRAALEPPPVFVPVLPAERCGGDRDEAGPDLTRALFGDELWSAGVWSEAEGEGSIRRRPRPPTTQGLLQGNVTLVSPHR